MSDRVDDLFDYDQIVAEQTPDTQHATHELTEAESDERIRAMQVTHEIVIGYVDDLLDWLTGEIDQLLPNVQSEKDVGMLRGLGTVKAKLQADRLNAKGVLGDG